MLGTGREAFFRRPAAKIASCVAVVAGFSLFAVAPVVGDGTNDRPAPAAEVIATTHPATSAQVAGATGLPGASAAVSAKKKRKKPVQRRVKLISRITDQEILTEEGKGTFVGIKCPPGWKAVSGGALTSYVNLLISSSAPNNPLTRKYTPNTWWLAVTNVNVDGNGGTLSWLGVVNCLSPVPLGPK